MIAAFTLNVSIDRRYLVENGSLNQVNRVKECTATAGGKGLNVARVIHVLGEEVVAGGIAGGHLGEFVISELDREGIPHHFTRAAGESRCCINIKDTKTGAQTEYLEPGLTVTSEESEAFMKDFEGLAGCSDVITLSGSLPKGLPADFYARLIRRAKTMGRPVLLDASGASLTAGIAAAPAYIKPNEDEIAALTNTGIEDEAALSKAMMDLHRAGIDRVVLSMGSRGAMIACGEGLFKGRPPKIQAVNTVGCGDSMTAAFAVALQRKMNAEESLRFAIGVSAASALNPGTGGLEMKDFEAVLPNVTVEKL